MSSLDLTPDRGGGGGGGRDLAWERGFSVKGGGGGGQSPKKENVQGQARELLSRERPKMREEQGVSEQAAKIEALAREKLQDKQVDLSPGNRKALGDDIRQQWKALDAGEKEKALDAWNKGENSPQAVLAGAYAELQSAKGAEQQAMGEKAVLAKAGALAREDQLAGKPLATPEQYHQRAEDLVKERGKEGHRQQQEMYTARDKHVDSRVAEGMDKSQARAEWNDWRAYEAKQAYLQSRTDGLQAKLEKPAGERPAGPPPTLQELDKAKRELQPDAEQKAERAQWNADLSAFCASGPFAGKHIEATARELDARDRQTAALALHHTNKDEARGFVAGRETLNQETRTSAQELARAEARQAMDPGKREVAERTERLVERFPERKELTLDQARTLIKDATQLEKDRAKLGRKANAETLKQYASNAKSLDNKNNLPETAANTRASFYSYRAAVVKEAVQSGKDAQRDLSSAWSEQKELKKEAAENGWRGPKGIEDFRATNQEFNAKWTAMEGRKADAEQRLQAAAQVLTRYPLGELEQRENLAREDVRKWKEDPDRARSTSKRESEGKLDRGWQDTVFDNAKREDRPAVAVMSLTGARPGEIALGAKVQRTEDGGLDIKIKGEKVDDLRGMKERVVHITPEQVKNDKQAAYLHQLAGDKGGTKVTTDSSRGLSERIAAIGDREGLDVSGYSFRHGFATDSRLEGKMEKEFGPQMGHRAERSTRGYGS